MSDLPEHVLRNRVLWDDWAQRFVAAGEAAWAQATPSWGIWGVPEAQVGMFPEDLRGKEAIELGCGTAYISAWLARRGVRVVGLDNSAVQLATARRLQQQYGLDFPSCAAMPKPRRSQTPALIWRSPSMEPACGLIRSAGCLKPRGYCGRVDVLSFWSTRSY